MPCTCPIDAWPAPPGAKDRRPVFSSTRSYSGALAFSLPCGRCMGCRLDRARDLATRAVHEAQVLAEDGVGSTFVTLTFDDAHLPLDRSISVPFIQQYHRALRYEVGPFRYLLAGEYGGRELRPHYHAIYFGLDFREDRVLWKKAPSGGLLYRSPTLERAWPYGFAHIADYSPQAGGYVARYTTKKVGGDLADEVYRREAVDPATGEIRTWQVRPEFMVSSRNPGLGSAWFDRYACDAFPSDFLIVEGRKVPVPRYYLRKLEERERQAVVARRKVVALGMSSDNTERRLMTRHESQILRAQRLVRPLDGEL